MITPVNLIVTEHGDSSVGISDICFNIEAPFSKEESDEVMLNDFKYKIVSIYQEFCEMNVSADYDFEIENENLYI